MLAVDTSALVTRYVEEPRSGEVVALMDAEEPWCASDLVRCEVGDPARPARRHAPPGRGTSPPASTPTGPPSTSCPVDERCLSSAAEIGADFGLRVVDAIHLAAAARLPRPVRYLTLDPRQVLAAVALDLEPVPTPTD